MNVPEDLKYTKEHEWVRVEGERLTVGPPFFNKWMLPIGLMLPWMSREPRP